MWFVAFNIFSLYLIFVSLINMCLGMFLLWFILYGTLCTSWTWVTISFPILGICKILFIQKSTNNDSQENSIIIILQLQRLYSK